MITYGSVIISDNMYLSGEIEATPHQFVKERTIDGNPVLKRFQTPRGRSFELGTATSTVGNGVQGIWCQDVVDQMKALQETGMSNTLDYHGNTINAVIADMSGIRQMFRWEPITPNKKYVGTIKFTEG